MVALVNEVSTLRRHLEAYHKDQYLKWAKANNFLSMLPKCRKAKAEKAASAKLQTQLEDHHKPNAEKIIPYSDKAFREAATEWLIATNQPIQAFEHPSFHKMINIASRASNGVKIQVERQHVTKSSTCSIHRSNISKTISTYVSDSGSPSL
ncbi:hypothetical protein BDN72DRAFT_778481 [Pluteus cervinus]|uniref:Uncharacterized protein n=1 Tax=Pluteus cervinus TaxID=181527 RepID=A0ACD3A5R2_9AGAR|nr:hypothetical protein BDN72DRAFT_778481 [Pluteus cervinus]